MNASSFSVDDQKLSHLRALTDASQRSIMAVPEIQRATTHFSVRTSKVANFVLFIQVLAFLCTDPILIYVSINLYI